MSQDSSEIIVDEDYGRHIESNQENKTREKHFKVLGTQDEDIAYLAVLVETAVSADKAVMADLEFPLRAQQQLELS